MKKQRIDRVLVDRGLTDSRQTAQRLVLAGKVRINGVTAKKSSDTVTDRDQVDIVTPEPYVSRGGHKLEKALHSFPAITQGMTAIDVGASTGGFTDCLLQNGVKKVYAVDVGSGQLAWKLRQDPRVVVMEKTNARYLKQTQFPPDFEPADLITVDCSFISLKLILPPLPPLLKPEGWILALIKPQFEAGREDVSKGSGVISDPMIHQRVIADLQHFVSLMNDLHWKGTVESPLLGPAGNKEFLVALQKHEV